MEEKLKKVIKNNLCVMWIMWLIISAVFLGVFLNSTDINILVAGLPTKEITAGEDLSKYNGRRVSCTFHYVVNHVVDFYDEDDESKTIYTCGYLAADDAMQNPFCVFVLPDRAEQMEQMLRKTTNIKNGENVFITPVEVRGYVRKAKSRHVHHYVRAMNQVYGKTYAQGGDMYYIDDNGVSGLDPDAGIMYIILFMLLIFAAYVIGITINSLRYPKVISDFAAGNQIGRVELEREFLCSTEILGNVWIGPKFTFFYDGARFGILKNKDIVWAYIQKYRGKTTTYKLKLFTIDHKRCAAIPTRPEMMGGKLGGNDLLSYYSRICPHIVIGEDREKKRLYEKDFERFLQLQYYRNVNIETEDMDVYSRDFRMDQTMRGKSEDENSGSMFLRLGMAIAMLVIAMVTLILPWKEQRDAQKQEEMAETQKETIADSLVLSTQQLISCTEVKNLMERSMERYMGKPFGDDWEPEQEDAPYYNGERKLFCQEGKLHIATLKDQDDKIIQFYWETPFTQEKFADVYKCLRHCYEDTWTEDPYGNSAVWRFERFYVELYESEGSIIAAWTDRAYRDDTNTYSNQE